jgi:beta-lactamase class A
VIRRVRLTLVLVLVLGLGALASGRAQSLQDDLKSQFDRRLGAIAAGLDGVVGYLITDLTSGERVASRLAEQAFPTASTIKLAILYELLEQAEAGRMELDEPRPLERAEVVGGSGVLQHLSQPSLSLRDHAALMMIVSDNTATNVCIDAVGMEHVNTRMKAFGLDIRLRRKMMDSAAAARGDENVASPAALAGIAARLWKGDGLTPASRDYALEVLRKVNGAIRSAVPSRVRVASKTGSLSGVRAEAAVVELEGRPFSVAVMTTYLRDDEQGSRVIGAIADAAFSYFERLAHGGAYGRKP